MRNVNIFLLGFALATFCVKVPFDFATDAIIAYRISFVLTTVVFTALLMWIASLLDELLR